MKKPGNATLTLCAALALAACDGSGGHNDADSQEDGGKGAQGTYIDSAAQGTSIQTVPPPVGTGNPSGPPASLPTPPTQGAIDSAGGLSQPPADTLGRRPG